MGKNYCDYCNFSGIFSWIDKNIENAYEKTLLCMYVLYVYVTIINTMIFIIYLCGVYQTSSS